MLTSYIFRPKTSVYNRKAAIDFTFISPLYKRNIIICSLLNVRFGSLLGPRGLLLKYMWGENSDRENPVTHLPAFGTRLKRNISINYRVFYIAIFYIFTTSFYYCFYLRSTYFIINIINLYLY